MGLFGYIALVTSLIFSVLSLSLMLIIKNGKWGLRASLSSWTFTVLSSFILLYLLISGDFSVEYVFRNTERSLPLIYKISAFWSGSAGSLLLWALCNCLVCFFLYFLFNKRNRKYTQCLAAVTTAINLGFLTVLVFFSNPFKTTGFSSDGFGLNPSLQSIGMVFHPPTVILSYSCIFAAFGSYLYETIYSGGTAIKTSKRISLISWIILTLGITAGGIWAYSELGWGGYWSWDPIENSALVTWLFLTAHLHLSGCRKASGRSPLALISCTAFSILLGTFLARSGVISSVHTYSSQAGKTIILLSVLFTAVLCLLILIAVFRKRHKSGTNGFKLNSVMRRLPSYLLVICAVTIALMTVSPLFSIKGLKITEKTYDFVFGIFGLLILLVSTIYFTIKSKANKLKILITAISLVSGIITLLLPAVASYAAFTRIALSVSVFCMASFILSFIFASGNLLNNTGRFISYIIHLSIVLLALGFIGSRNMKAEASIVLSKGGTVGIGGYVLEMTDFYISDLPQIKSWNAVVSCLNGGNTKNIDISLSHYKKKDLYHSKAYISGSLKEDLYIIIENASDEGDILLKISLNRWVSLIWIGVALMLSSSVFLMCFRKISNDSKQTYDI